MDVTTGQIIRSWRLEGEPITQQTLAYQLGRALGTINRWEADAVEPRVKDIRAMEALKPGLVQALFAPEAETAKKPKRAKK
jgi:ribosome-binding protein aMBF1 (putative translation factor)